MLISFKQFCKSRPIYDWAVKADIGQIFEFSEFPGFIHAWNFSNIIQDEYRFSINEEYPDLNDFGLEESYGVCDSVQDFAKVYYDKLNNSERVFIVAFNGIFKKDQSSNDGWRWHKWGPYIGKQKPTCEYLYDEPEINEVWIFKIYEIIGSSIALVH